MSLVFNFIQYFSPDKNIQLDWSLTSMFIHTFLILFGRITDLSVSVMSSCKKVKSCKS